MVEIYWRLVLAQVRAQSSYRGSFVTDLIIQLVVPVFDVLTVVVLFQVTRRLGGFGPFEVLTMSALAVSAYAIADLVVGNIGRLGFHVRTGLLDAALVRPLSVLGQLGALDFSFRRIGRAASALVILGFALAHAGITWTPARVGIAIVAPIVGAVFFSAVMVATATVAFWWIDSAELTATFTHGGQEFATYPMTIYGTVLRRVFSLGLGFGFVGYYPTLALLGRPDPLGLPAWTAWCSPLVSVVAVLVAAGVWRFGVRRYRSTGS